MRAVAVKAASAILLATLALAGCNYSTFEDPEVMGAPAMVNDGGEPRLWILSKQEEVRTVGVGGPSRRSGNWRNDTYFHFQVQAFDTVTARPLWSRRLLTLGDAEARGAGPSRVIGSSADGYLLGQDGDTVWLLLDGAPMAVAVADGSAVADAAVLEQRNPELQGLLPREARHYGFDQGLVFMSADARRFVVRGPELKASPYTPVVPPAPPPELMANGRERLVPLLPLGDAPARQLMLGGQWLGLYTEKEAADAAEDPFGDNYRYPYTVLDEGALARRGFWRGRIEQARHFDDRFERVADLVPVPEAPFFLKGRFLKDLATGRPLVMDDPPGVLVWHSTRIDRDGRLALTRLDAGLRPLWKAELPLSESHTGNPVRYWQLPGLVVVMGGLETVDDGVSSRVPHLAAVTLADGRLRAWNLRAGTAAEN